MEKITELLVKELASRNYKELVKVVENLSFEDALKKLDGFNFEVDVCVIGDTKEYVGTDIFFDFNYKSLNGTIFCTPNNKCEIHEVFEIWLDNVSSPIATVDIAFDGEVDNVRLK